MTLEEAFREMESNLEEADQEELEEDFLSWRENLQVPAMRYFYYAYKGEIACIPEWYICRHYPKTMRELEDMAREWLERNKRGDFGKEPW